MLYTNSLVPISIGIRDPAWDYSHSITPEPPIVLMNSAQVSGYSKKMRGPHLVPRILTILAIQALNF